jgi:hypothetical protein
VAVGGSVLGVEDADEVEMHQRLVAVYQASPR